MAKGRRRRRVTWRSAGTLAHAFVGMSSTSVCRSYRLTETGRHEGEDHCLPCEIALAQLW